jgi:hypothetical protein
MQMLSRTPRTRHTKDEKRVLPAVHELPQCVRLSDIVASQLSRRSSSRDAFVVERAGWFLTGPLGHIHFLCVVRKMLVLAIPMDVEPLCDPAPGSCSPSAMQEWATWC